MMDQTHLVTYIGNHTASVDRFVHEANAREHFARVKQFEFTRFASLHINLKLSEVYANPETTARLIESTTEAP